jgi:sugar porter (SP) family MFS transporter
MPPIPDSDKPRVFGYGAKEEATSNSTANTTGTTATPGGHIEPPRGGIASRAVMLALISSVLFGYQTIVLNSCGELIAAKLQWCGNAWQSDCKAGNFYLSLTNASVYLGAACGAWLMGRSRVFLLGARMQMVISDILFALGGLSCAVAVNAAGLVLGRILSGVGLGMCAIAAPMYIAEVSPREQRGANCAMNGVGITLGILAASVLGLPNSPPPSNASESLSDLDGWYWRVLLGIQMLPAMVQGILFLRVLPIDSPAFLINCKRYEEARNLLYKTYGVEPALPSDGAPAGSWEGLQLETQLVELREASEAAKAIPQIKVHQAVTDPFLRCAVFLGFGLACFQQLSGINALMSYSNNLFSQGGIPASDANFAALTMCTLNLCASILSSNLADKWGRRKLLLWGSLGQALSMLTLFLSVTFKSSVPASLLGIITVGAFTLFVTSFSAGLGAITWLYLSEIYPMEIRGSVLSACGVINWLSSFAVVFGAKFLNLPQTCFTFFWISAIGTLMVFCWVVETKGCSMEDSPLTPRSGRSSSALLTPVGSPRGDFTKMEDDDDGDYEEGLKGMH